MDLGYSGLTPVAATAPGRISVAVSSVFMRPPLRRPSCSRAGVGTLCLRVVRPSVRAAHGRTLHSPTGLLLSTIVVKFEEITLKVQKVRKSSRSTFSHSC